MSCVAAIGMFDGVHLGHQSLVEDVLSHARARNCKAAIFTFNRHPMQIISPERSPRLLTTQRQRCEYLREAGADETHVLHFDEEMRMFTAQQFMSMLRRDFGVEMLVLGFNHRFGHDRLSSLEEYKQAGMSAGVEVVQAQELVLEGGVGTVSSSAIRASLMQGDVLLANQMLGRPFALRGCIGHGQQVGRTIGFPTANVVPEQECQQVPRGGVYVGYLDGMPAMINIGTRPTLGRNLTCTIEAHVLGYEGDLYGRAVELQFKARLREEQKFASLHQLQQQLESDRAKAMSILLKN